MQINYARYPGVVGNDWPGAEQNPAYSSSAKSAPRRIFLVTGYWVIVCICIPMIIIHLRTHLVIAREYNDRGDPVIIESHADCVRASFTGLLRVARNDKVGCR